MNALEECHAKGFLYKSLGNCNTAKQNVVDCLKVARQKRLDENRTNAQAKKEEHRLKVKELQRSLGLDE